MNETLEFATRAIFIGIGATAVLDAWSEFLSRAFKVPAPVYAMVGRWLGYFPRGKFAHQSIAKADPIKGEAILGWSAHYIIGIAYAGLLLAIVGLDWARAPTVLPALIFGIVSVLAPFFVIQPGMGAGIAASKMTNPNAARLRSLANHAVFGAGLFVTAWLAASLNLS